MLTTSDLHSGPVGREWMAFVAATKQPPKAGDGAATASPSTQVVAALPTQPAPSPQPTITGGAR